eukprot:6830142-Prorocentrum_lima.AAC.1
MPPSRAECRAIQAWHHVFCAACGVILYWQHPDSSGGSWQREQAAECTSYVARPGEFLRFSPDLQ